MRLFPPFNGRSANGRRLLPSYVPRNLPANRQRGFPHGLECERQKPSLDTSSELRLVPGAWAEQGEKEPRGIASRREIVNSSGSAKRRKAGAERTCRVVAACSHPKHSATDISDVLRFHLRALSRFPPCPPISCPASETDECSVDVARHLCTVTVAAVSDSGPRKRVPETRWL